MNHNLKDIITTTLQEILAEDPNFFFNDKLTILTWKSKKVEGALITKVGNLRYIGYLRKDIKGQDYWKYRPLNPEPSGEESSESPNSLDNIAKFQQRQAQVQAQQNQLNHHGKSNATEQSVNSSTS